MNQCQGCQAGWELVESPFGGKNHQVPGGYHGEIVGCTAHLYARSTTMINIPVDEKWKVRETPRGVVIYPPSHIDRKYDDLILRIDANCGRADLVNAANEIVATLNGSENYESMRIDDSALY